MTLTHWPDGDAQNGGIKGWGPNEWVQHQIENAQHFASLVHPNKRHTAICAGAHVGIMPFVYARAGFEHVLAFEPDPLNFECAVKNLNAQLPNSTVVKLSQCALGNGRGWARIDHDTENSGKSHIGTLHNVSQVKFAEVVPVTAIDQFQLQACDLIQLDIEGYELLALEGAVDTVRQHRPVIVVEMNGLTGRYGLTDGDLWDWFKDNGYVEEPTRRRNHDRVWHHVEERLP